MAVELYHNRLLTDRSATDYVTTRGLERATLERCRVGYASGDELVSYLRWRRLPIQAAMRVGLLGRGGREFLAGRVIVPELRHGQPVWLVGRTIVPEARGPNSLGLSAPKPILGWEAASGSRAAIVVEGVFDWLTLVQWRYPALALVGTRGRPAAVQALGTRFRRVYLALGADEARQAASAAIEQALSP